VHAKNPDGSTKREAEIFGGSAQQDCQEYYQFITDNIHDETNVHRDRKGKGDREYTREDGTVVEIAMKAWEEYSKANKSLIDKYFRGLLAWASQCHNCGYLTYTFHPSDVWILPLTRIGNDESTTLDRLMAKDCEREEFSPKEHPDLKCDKCAKAGRSRQMRYARMPDRLAICFNRFETSYQTNSITKKMAKVTFPIRNLDLTKYFINQTESATPDDHHFGGQMLYDCYAVTVHMGKGINGGHYYSYVRDDQARDPSDWFLCNDESVTRVRIGSNRPGDRTETMYQDGNTCAYMVYYQRQGS
jgi:ubiquitin carboxyl-terminal hydrolase 8